MCFTPRLLFHPDGYRVYSSYLSSDYIFRLSETHPENSNFLFYSILIDEFVEGKFTDHVRQRCTLPL
jgi:hypothetical protein